MFFGGPKGGLPPKKHQVGAKTDFKLLTRFLLPEGFIPPVVPEVDSVTVGGAIAGLVMESSSFRYGFLHNAVVAMEAMRGSGAIGGWDGQFLMVRIDMDKKKWLLVKILGMGWLDMIWQMREALDPGSWSLKLLVSSFSRGLFGFRSRLRGCPRFACGIHPGEE